MDNGESIKVLVTALTDLTACLKIADNTCSAVGNDNYDRILTLLNGLKSSGATPYRCPASDCYWSSNTGDELWKHLNYAHNFSNDIWACPHCSRDVAGPQELLNHFIQFHVTISGARVEEY